MTVSDPITELQRAIETAIQSGFADIHTAHPGEIVKYDPAKQTADIQLLIKRRKTDNTTTAIPILPNVPVRSCRTKEAGIHLPLKKGDQVLVLFSERDCDNARQGKGVFEPASARKFHLSDALAIPFSITDSEALKLDSGDEEKITVFNKTSKITLSSAGEVMLGKVGSEQQEPLVLGKVLIAYLTDLHAQLDALVQVLVGGNHALSTGPGNPTAPNPATLSQITQIKTELQSLKSKYVETESSNIASKVAFTEKG